MLYVELVVMNDKTAKQENCIHLYIVRNSFQCLLSERRWFAIVSRSERFFLLTGPHITTGLLTVHEVSVGQRAVNVL